MMSLNKESWKLYAEEVSRVLESVDATSISKAVQAIESAINANSMIWVFGNGGSAATASHFCVDLSKGAALRSSRIIRAIPLMDLTPIQSAWSNDLSYAEAMSMSLKHNARPGDLVIVISGSGNSPNILNVTQMAHEMNLKVIGMTGFDGGKVRELLDFEIHVPAMDMQVVEDSHHTICHFISKVV
jgi:D-sedoheptulose 7-phosphate isomerase